jgi:hypothetical protein
VSLKFNPFTGNFDLVGSSSTAGFVPYTGATANLDMGSQSIIVQYLLDQAPLNSVGVDDRKLYDAGGTLVSVDWGGRQLYDANNPEVLSFDWGTRQLFDETGAFKSLVGAQVNLTAFMFMVAYK